MSETLTAAELAAVYEPAFEAAGERPRDVHYIPDPKWNHPYWEPVEECGVIDESIRSNNIELPVSLAANACRCWAEDWLHRHPDVAHYAVMGDCAPIPVELQVDIFMSDDPDDTQTSAFEGPTIHHALAFAVIAVAKAKEKI